MTPRIVVILVIELAIFGLVSSLALALHAGFPLAQVTPWWIVRYVASIGGVTPAVWRAAGFGVFAAALAPALWFAGPVHVDLGSSRFARWGEARAAGLFAPSGVLLGKLGRWFLRSDEPLHVLVAAPTRSGKGVGIVIPNLLSWHGSALVMDIKYENHEVTSGFRAAHGQRVFRFSPADSEGRSHRYNPLDAVRTERSHRVSDLQRLAAILLPAPDRRDSFWQDEARSLFVGIALYVLDTPGIPHTLGQIYRTLVAKQPLHAICGHLLEKRPGLDPACQFALASFMHKAEKERSGVRSTLTAALGLWANPLIDAATATSDLHLADLRRTPTTIYVAVSLDQLASLARLLNLFFQQAIALLAQSRPGADEPVPVLFLLDEFASLGRMDLLKDALAFLGGYGVRICTIVQGLGQLDELYDRAGRESILQNSALQVLFAANDESTARYVSERLGRKTIRTLTRSFLGGSRMATKTVGFAGRALLLPDEVRRLGPEEALVFKEGAWPVRARKIRYHREPAFRERLRGAAPVPKLEVKATAAPVFDLAPGPKESPELQQLRALSQELVRAMAE